MVATDTSLVEARDSAKCLTMHRIVFLKNYLVQSDNNAKVEKLCILERSSIDRKG